MFRESIFSILKLNISEIIEKNYINADDIHIIINFSGLRIYRKELDDFTKDWSHDVGKLCKFKCRYLTVGLDKELRFRKIEYLCTSCGTVFERIYPFRKVIKKVMSPRYCTKRGCSNKEFETKSFETYEVGRFMIGDLNETNSVLYRKCFVFRNLPYFSRKIKEINIGEEVEILGILKV